MDAVAKLSEILTKAPELLSAISAEDAAKHEALDKWSKKQELGHLVDSACNNHQRVVRAQLETEPSLPDYDGDRWVALHDYQGMEWNEIIGRWRVLNKQLVGASAISQQAVERKLTVGGGNPITLSFLVNDYVDHLLHHLRHIGIDVGARA